jgi:hypothetical protein
MLNADGTIWVDRLGQPMETAGTMQPATANPSSRRLPLRGVDPARRIGPGVRDSPQGLRGVPAARV